MTYYWGDLVRKPTEDKSKYKGSDAMTPEEKWCRLGAERRERLARLLEIGSREAIDNCRTLAFYPAGTKTDSLVFLSRLHFLAGLLDANLLEGQVPAKKRLLQLEASAKEEGYTIVEIDPTSHHKIA